VCQSVEEMKRASSLSSPGVYLARCIREEDIQQHLQDAHRNNEVMARRSMILVAAKVGFNMMRHLLVWRFEGAAGIRLVD